MKGYNKGVLIEGIGLGTEQAFVNYINKTHKDMKKECRIKEINEQINALKCEKKRLKKHKSIHFELNELNFHIDESCDMGKNSVCDNRMLLDVRHFGLYRNIGFWLNPNCDWVIEEDLAGKILVPTKK